MTRGASDSATVEASASAFAEAVEAWRAGAELETVIDDLLAAMTPDEKLSMLDGDTDFWEGRIHALTYGSNARPAPAARCARLGIPGFAFVDGPRGMAIPPGTCFPVSMARGAAFDVDLERRIGIAIGREVRARGGDLFGGVCVNLLRHPAWGRAQETYGEDPLHVGEMGAALMTGAQTQVMACVKHFACNSMETSRHRVDVRVAEAPLHEVYLPHFRRIVEGGVAVVMSAYNSLNGAWCGHSTALLRDVLRGEWGFDQTVITDFIFGIRDAAASVKATVDIEMPYGMIRMQRLPSALRDGAVTWDEVDGCVRRTLRTLIRFAHLREAPAPGEEVVASPPHVALTLEAARKSIVLLENGAGLLPLDPQRVRRLAVLGPLSRVANLGDGGSSAVHPPYAVTPLEGLREAFPEAEIVASDDPDAAAASDAAIVVVGVTMEDEGEFLDLDAQVPLLERFAPPFADDGQRERFDYLVRHQEVLAEPPGGDRASLRLKPQDEALILEVAKRNPRTVVVLTGGSAFITEPWREQVGAILMAWYPGMEGGRALAEVICGACNPSGHMPFATPADEADLPPFPIVTDTVEYGALHGQWLFDATRARVRYPFGHGLSYAEFAPGGVDIGHDESGAWAEVVWRNRGSRAGRDVIQVYAVATADEARRRLIGFMPIGLAGGEDRSVRVPLDLRPLQKRDVGAWSWRDGAYRIEAARFSGDPDAATVAARLVDGRLSRWP